jgi:tRNA-specific 2-thiouridylase
VLRVVQGVDHPALFSRMLRAGRPHWISGSTPAQRLSVTARIRHRHQDQPCTVELTGADGCVVEFEQPQRAVTPGQSVVFYDGETCLGGAVIEVATG